MSIIHDKIASLLHAQEFRPFDSEIKSIIKKPHVFKLLWNDIRQAEIVNLREDFPGNVPSNVEGEAAWLSEEFIREKGVFRSDLVAEIDGSIYHIEQQTKHDKLVMLRRMAEYATLISSFYRFEPELYQLYYYTGDSRVQWDRRIKMQASVLNSSWSLTNRFIFFDAGSHDAWRMLDTGNVDFATLGLLARTIPSDEDFISSLVKLIYKQFTAGTPEFYSKLVTCIVIGSLRNRGIDVSKAIPMNERQRLPAHERRVLDTWLSISEIKGRDAAYEIMSRLTDLEREHGVRFPREFGRWAVHHITEVQLKDLENGVTRFSTLPVLFEASGIDWPPIETSSSTLRI